MVELFVVCPVDKLGEDFLDPQATDRFVDVKKRALGYGEASINTPVAPGSICSRSDPPPAVRSDAAPLGAVKTEDDAKRFLSALAAELPNIGFRMELRQYPDAIDVVWHSCG
jgi:hypothetical protein